MIFLFVMPVLIGAFLRRDRECFILIINIRFNKISLSSLLNLVQERLSTGGLSNEVVSEGCVKWQKPYKTRKGVSSLVLTLVDVLSPMKMNLYIKTSSAIIKSPRDLKNWFEDEINVSNINECVCYETTNIVNTRTEEGLITSQDKNYLEVIFNNRMCPKETLSKHGNLGKNVLVKIIKINIILLWHKLKDPLIHLMSKLNLEIMIIYVLNYLLSSLPKQEGRYHHGGKISKKAKALGNAKDTVNYFINDMNKYKLENGLTYSKCRSKLIIKQPRVIYLGEKLNLQSLNKNLLITVRHYSTTKEESVYNNIEQIKRLIRNNNVLNWPDNETLGLINKEVFKKQMELVHLAKEHGPYSEKVYERQLVLCKSLLFRIQAVVKLSRSQGSRTPGVDNICLNSRQEDKATYIALVEWMKNIIIKPKNYRADPIRRIWILKSNGEQRPLGIPTIKDRALQHLLNLIVEPLVEMTGEDNSYGFRTNRSAKQAIAHLRAQLKTIDMSKYENRAIKENRDLRTLRQRGEEKWILDADIKGFFDNINHKWLVENLFLNYKLKLIVEAWLKSGAIDKGIFHKTELGTPQGGIISPTLANFTLNGLEKVVYESIYELSRNQEGRINILLKDNTRTRIASGLAYVRYADDFIIIVRSKHILNTYIIPTIKEFLYARGLTLSEEKTKIFRLKDKDTQLDFLGYTFKYQDKWRHDKHIFYSNHANDRGIALYPNRDKVLNIIKRIKNIFKESQNSTAYTLIAKLNPIIRGWSGYFNMSNSSHYRDTVRNAIYHLIWKWASKKHRRWGKKAIAKKYFLTMKNSKNNEYKLIKNHKWVFHGETLVESRYGGIVKSIYLQDVGTCSKLLSSKVYVMPLKYRKIHAYHPDYMQVVNFNTNINFQAMGLNSNFKIKLLKAQNDICPTCKKPLITSIGLYEGLHIHHILPIAKGGKRNDIKNMILLHAWCHKDIDHGIRSLTKESKV